jgi:glycosyltransferase involved in cell wall biosynthesis
MAPQLALRDPVATLDDSISAPTTDCEAAATVEQVGRVLFLITTTDFGGTESILLELVRRMRGRGLELEVCSLCPPGQIGREMQEMGVRTTTLGMAPDASFTELAKGAIRLARILDERQIDLAQTFLYRANVVGAIAAKLARRKPALISSQRSLNPAGFHTAARAVRWTRRFSDLVVTVSSAVREEVLATEKTHPEKVVVIRNGVDTTLFAPRDGTAMRASLGMADSALVVGGVGRLATVKGFAHLIKATALARQRGVEMETVLVGDGPLRPSLEKLAEDLQIAQHVHFLGMRRDLPELYAAMDVFALPSIQEGSPNALMEAMACGKPVLASPVGGVPEIIEDRRTGLLVAPAEPERWADAIERLESSPQLRNELAANARNNALDSLDIELTVAQHADLYKRTIQSRRP